MNEEALKRLGVKIETCCECGRRFRFEHIPPHNLVTFDEKTGDPCTPEGESGYYCSEECGKKSEARRKAKGEDVTYYFMNPEKFR